MKWPLPDYRLISKFKHRGMCRVRYSFFIFLVAMIVPGKIVAQRDDVDYEYSREVIYGITKATNSGFIGGFMFKYNSKLKENSLHGLGVEIVNVKHPLEQKVSSGYGGRFILGKENYLYSMRFSYSREKVFGKKASQRGVQVNGIAAIGPTIGFEAPYYVEVATSDGYSVKRPFDVDKDLQPGGSNIIGTGHLFQGVQESSIVPGLNTRLGLSFEFSTFKYDISGIEIGFQSDLFARKIILMPTAKNYSFFPSGYITVFFGLRK